MPPLISLKMIIYHETIDKVLVSISQHPCLFLVSVLTTIITEKISSCIWLTNHTLDFPLLECLISQQYLKNIWTYLHNLTQYLYNLTNTKQYYLYLNIISVIFSNIMHPLGSTSANIANISTILAYLSHIIDISPMLATLYDNLLNI